MSEELNKNQSEDAIRNEQAVERQSEHRMRQRIPRAEKVEFSRDYSSGMRERRFNRDGSLERRTPYSRPTNYNERGGRRTYLSDIRRNDSRYQDNDDMQYTNNLNTYHEAGVAYPQRRNNEDFERGNYISNPNSSYNPDRNNFSRRSYNPNSRNRAPRVAYAKGNYAARPIVQQAPKPKPKPVPQPKKEKKPKAIQIPKRVIHYKDLTADPEKPIRLNRYLSSSGVCSRRDADTFIQFGLVKVNDVVVTELGTKVMITDEVKFKNKVVKPEDKIYVVLNKPKGYITTSDDPQHRKTVLDLVRGACYERIYPVGRLDRNTTGVLLLTNDGEIASRLTHPQYLKKKIYHVFLDKEVTEEDMNQIRTGITLEDGDIKADAIEYAKDDDKKQVGIEIHSGKNRIVRRIFESLGYHVVKLDRVYFAGLTKKNIKRGGWRYLTSDEVSMLKMGAFE